MSAYEQPMTPYISDRTKQRMVESVKDKGIDDIAVLTALYHVPRHRFVEQSLWHRAYNDSPLPIGHLQTISQPSVVAQMAALARVSEPHVKKVLDVGTGSGYQAAVLSRLTKWVFTVERIGELQKQAQRRLQELGYKNISYLLTDGANGWRQKAPFDAIIAAAAPQTVPLALLEQLSIGGRLVLPVGGRDQQVLRVIERTEDGYDSFDAGAVSFVPLLNSTE